MNSDKLKNNLSEREILPADEQKICNLLGKLDSVSCPNDFDFRLKARIANADQKDFKPSMWHTLRYILPVTATAVFAAFMMVQGGMIAPWTNQKENNFVAESSNFQPSANQTVLQNEAKNVETADSNVILIPAKPGGEQNSQMITVSNSKSELAVKTFPKMRNADLPKSSTSDESVMSRDLGVGQNRKPIYPAGINPNPLTLPPTQNQNVKPVAAGEMLEIVGIQTEIVGGKMIVKSVTEKSLAGLSGFKAGDLIEAIDDVKIGENDFLMKSNAFKKITVLRDGKTLIIRLKPD